MNINPDPTQELQLFDNYGLWHVPFWYKPWFIIVMILAGCFLLALALMLFLKFKPRKQKVVSPWKQALLGLDKLKKSSLHSIEQSSAFYARLTTIVKQYMSALYAHDVCSFTDQQMVEYVQTLTLFDAQKNGLERIFSAGELIKFANQDALQQQMANDMQFSVDFVRATKIFFDNKSKKTSI